MSAQVFVLMPTFNVEPFIGIAIESVLNQTFQDWELLVLDDCSTDNTLTIAQSYRDHDSRIRVLQNSSNLGMLGNWNKGVTFCKSPFFIKLDGDDVWHPEMIQSSLNIIEKDETVGMVFAKYININSENEIIPHSEIMLPDFASDKSFSCIPLVMQGVSRMLSYSILRQGLSLMRSKIFAEIGGYRFLLSKKTQASTDTEFYFRVGCHYKIHCINTVLYYYRVHKQSISALDEAAGLLELKMYEVKLVINDYYYEQGKISKDQWKKNRAETKFKYLVFLNYQFRTQKRIFDFLSNTFTLLIIYPNQTLRHFVQRFRMPEPESKM
jgi:glycosyltransferase involved in cell wall biosynthesis